MEMAQVTAKRSTCPRAQVGVVIAQEGRVVSIGYNGSAPGQPHCIEVGCERRTEDKSVHGESPLVVEVGSCERTIHAEANAIAWAARAGVSTVGATMYCTHAPCYACAKLMVSAGIIKLHYVTPYRDLRGVELLDKSLVELHEH